MHNDVFSDLLGQTIRAIEVSEDRDEVKFALADGRLYKLWHAQDCCEQVRLEEVVGDLEDLIDSPLSLAEEVAGDSGERGHSSEYESFTWTFYKLATIKGSVTLRWLGTSNGYYSETVDFEEIIPTAAASGSSSATAAGKSSLTSWSIGPKKYPGWCAEVGVDHNWKAGPTLTCDPSIATRECVNCGLKQYRKPEEWCDAANTARKALKDNP